MEKVKRKRKVISFTLPQETIDVMGKGAEREKRSKSNYLEWLIHNDEKK